MGCVIVVVGLDLVLVDVWFYVICDEMVIVGLVDLIMVLILLKKLVVGLDGLVLDVK